MTRHEISRKIEHYTREATAYLDYGHAERERKHPSIPHLMFCTGEAFRYLGMARRMIEALDEK